MNPLDLCVIAFLAISGLLAFVRGFVREVLSIGSWIASGIIAVTFFPQVDPTVRTMIRQAWLADIVAFGALFVGSLLVLSVVVGFVSARVRGSFFGSTDRVLGLAFGLGRAVLLLCLGYLLAARLVTPDHWPAWATEARSLPLLANGAALIEAQLPRSVIDRSTQAIVKAGRTVEHANDAAGMLNGAAQAIDPAAPPPPAADRREQGGADFETLRRPPPPRAVPASGTGYDAEATRQMDRAFESVDGVRK